MYWKPRVVQEAAATRHDRAAADESYCQGGKTQAPGMFIFHILSGFYPGKPVVNCPDEVFSSNFSRLKWKKIPPHKAIVLN